MEVPSLREDRFGGAAMSDWLYRLFRGLAGVSPLRDEEEFED